MTGWPWHKPTPPVPPAPPVRAVAVIVYSEAGQPVAGASCAMQTSQTDWLTGTTGADGVLTWPTVPASLANTQLKVEAEGYVTLDESIVLDNQNQQVRIGLGYDPGQANAVLLPGLKPEHVDPSVFTLEQLAKIRGAMWTNRAAIPFGPRGIPQTPTNQPDNINAMDYYEWYGADDRALMLANYKAQGYTHAVTGPVIDPDGYHGRYPTYAGPLTQDWWDTYLDAMQEWWDAGITPVHFAIPDFPGWSVDRAKAELEPFFLQPRAQKLLRFIVLAWEPSGWFNRDFVNAAEWLHRIFLNAIIGLHSWPDHNAPGQSSEIEDGSLTEGQMWANVAPFIHVFLEQTAVTFGGDAQQQADWLQMWDRTFQGSWDSRFLDGFHGWPTNSAWPDHGIWAFPSEFYSWAAYWWNSPEAEAQAWGDLAMRAGARGYLDGGTVPVP